MQKLIIILFLGFLSACSSTGVDDTAGSSGENLDLSPSYQGVRASIDPKSLIIKEVCPLRSGCEYYGYCHGIHFRLENSTGQSVQVYRVVREVLDESGHLEESRAIEFVRDSVVIPTHSEETFPKGVCTSEYPGRTIPFLYGRTVRLEIDYQYSDGSTGFVMIDGRYNYERQP